MDDDWDLHAVVKGCSAAVNTTNVSNTTAAAAANTSIENPFPRFSSMTFDDDKSTSYDFPNIIDYENPFQDLQEIYQEFCGDPPPPDIPAATIPAAQVFQPQQEQMQPSLGMNMQMQPSLGMNMQMQPSLGMNMQMQGNTDLKSFMLGSSSHNFPAMNSQPTRPRKRKNQQTKMVRQMTQEELSADSWAWRKYGQKPIKGSSHPRNYYRCSTSKGCAARKQVERSPNDPGIFIVSYSGEHTHARPSHRSSLAGSTRPKLSTTTRNNNMIINNNNNNPLLFPKGLISSSSTFSPNTPLMEGEETAQNDDVEIVEEDGDEDDDDNNGDLFKGFHDSDDHDSSGGGGGDSLFSSGLLASPPWTSTSSAVNGGGCG